MNTSNNKLSPSMLFILTMTCMASFSALSTDIMLPALPAIGDTFQVNGQRLQEVITFFYLGVFGGELVFGPLSDRFGRRPSMMLGSVFFLIGTAVCLFVQSYEWLLFGRVLQGFGGAGPKIVVRALLRDLYSGPYLARVFSFVYTLFIFIPMIAPVLGQGITYIGGWVSVFYFLFIFCAGSTLLFSMTQPETLSVEKRLPLNFVKMGQNSLRVFSHNKVVLLTFISGIVFGMKLTYLSNAQQMFASYYDVTSLFPLYFALLASAIGLAFFLNTRLVMIYGGYKLCWFALGLLLCATGVLSLVTFLSGGIPSFLFFMSCFYCMFFCFGLLWGNVGALSMDFLGDIAGLGSTLISAGSSLVAFLVASLVGTLFGADFFPASLSFVVLAFFAIIFFWLVSESKHTHSITSV